MTLQLQIDLLMLYQGGRSANASLLAPLCDRPKMPELGIEPGTISTKVLDVLASEHAVAQP